MMNRQEIGHWEGHLSSFKGNRQHALVLHERKLRYTAVIRLKSKTAQETITAILTFFKALPKELFKSITFDNGTECSKHKDITDQLGVPSYFCDGYASWQKESVENQNGRLRRDFPRKTDSLAMNDHEFEQIILSHNLGPRKVLNGLSPIEALAKHMRSNIIFFFNKALALHM